MKIYFSFQFFTTLHRVTKTTIAVPSQNHYFKQRNFYGHQIFVVYQLLVEYANVCFYIMISITFARNSKIWKLQRISSNKKFFYVNTMRSVKSGTRKEYLQLSAIEFSRKSFPGLTESFRGLSKYT